MSTKFEFATCNLLSDTKKTVHESLIMSLDVIIRLFYHKHFVSLYKEMNIQMSVIFLSYNVNVSS